MTPILVHVTGPLSPDTVAKVGKASETVDKLSEFTGLVVDPKKFGGVATLKSISSMAGKIAPLLGAVGPALGLVALFAGGGESEEVSLMKQHFEVTTKKLDDIQKSVDALKSQYLGIISLEGYKEKQLPLLTGEKNVKTMLQYPTDTSRRNAMQDYCKQTSDSTIFLNYLGNEVFSNGGSIGSKLLGNGVQGEIKYNPEAFLPYMKVNIIFPLFEAPRFLLVLHISWCFFSNMYAYNDAWSSI